jgi:hypothetical protein
MKHQSRSKVRAAVVGVLLLGALGFATRTVHAEDCSDAYGKWQEIGPGEGGKTPEEAKKALSDIRDRMKKEQSADCDGKACEESACRCKVDDMASTPRCRRDKDSKRWECRAYYRTGCFCSPVKRWF